MKVHCMASAVGMMGFKSSAYLYLCLVLVMEK